MEKLSAQQKKDACKLAETFEHEEYSEDKIKDREQRAYAHYKSRKGIVEIWDSIRFLFEIAKHPKIWGMPVTMAAVAAVAYLVFPVDAVPDAVPLIGLLDDIAVITALLNKIKKQMTNKVKENAEVFLLSLPSDLRNTAVKFFNIEDTSVNDQAFNPAREQIFMFYLHLSGGAGKVYDRLEEKCRELEQNGRTDTFVYRLCKKIMNKGLTVFTGLIQKNIGTEVQDYLDMYSQQAKTRYLLSVLFFVISLISFRFSDSSTVFLWISSFFMGIAYLFSAVALCRFIYSIFIFLKGGFRNRNKQLGIKFFDSGVAAVFYKRTGIAEALSSETIKQLRTNTLMRKVVYNVFNNMIVVFLLKILSLSLALGLFKYFATLLQYNLTPLQILIAPIAILLPFLR